MIKADDVVIFPTLYTHVNQSCCGMTDAGEHTFHAFQVNVRENIFMREAKWSTANKKLCETVTWYKAAHMEAVPLKTIATAFMCPRQTMPNAHAVSYKRFVVITTTLLCRKRVCVTDVDLVFEI